MTLGEGKRKVLMLIDEYSSGGSLTEDADISQKMNDFFDLAQKDVVQYKPLVKRAEIPLVTGAGDPVAYPLPVQFKKLYRLWLGTEPVTRMGTLRGGELLFPDVGAGTLQMEYLAVPAPIGPNTPDDYVFEVTEDAAACMPYYVACLQVLVDLVVDYQPPMGLYNAMTAKLDSSLPGSGGGRVSQRMFRGRGG